MDIDSNFTKKLDMKIEYLKMKNKYISLKNSLNNNQTGGGQNFKPGDRFVSSGYYGRVIRTAMIDEFGLDLYALTTYYVVEYDNGSNNYYPNAIRVERNGRTHFVLSENDMEKADESSVPKLGNLDDILNRFNNNNDIVKPSVSSCRFKRNQKVILLDGTYFIRDTASDTYLENKNGTIDMVFKDIKGNCMYNVLLSDGRTVAEVPENKLRSYHGSSLIDYVPKLNDVNAILNQNSPSNNLLKINDIVSPPKNNNKKSFDIYDALKINNINATFSDNLYSPYSTSNTKTVFVPQLINTKDYDLDEENDSEYVEEIINFYYKKVLKWITDDIEYKKVKKHNKFMKSKKGYQYLTKILKSFVKKNNNIKWYDMRSKDVIDDVKDYIKSKLVSI